MQIVKDHAPVERFGAQTKSNFQIAGTAQAFEILSDGLYSNKIKAVIRELSTNAVDAHVALFAQKNPSVKITRDIIAGLNPYHVHMPNRLEPFFSIRDFGIGLSHDDIMQMYVTYFHSNKCTSNDYVGCLGLGSKSPFAYTDTFTITSYFNGEKRVYMAVIDNGFPDVSVVTDGFDNPIVEQTNEPNGLEIKIPVKMEDNNTFAEEAKALYPHFILKPKLSGNSYAKFEEIKYVLSGDFWGVRESDSHDAMAIMGNIAYPIDANILRDAPANVIALLQSDIDINFDIGSLQITPSRESLSYKDSTKKMIVQRCQDILVDMQKYVDKAFENCKCMWEARCLARKLFYGSEGLLSQLTKVLSIANISWKNKKLGSSEVCLHKPQSSVPVVSGIEVVEFYNARKRGYYNQSTTVKQKNDPASFEPESDITFVEMDIPRGAFARCKFAVEEGKLKRVIAVRFSTTQARTDFLDLVGLEATHAFTLASSLDKPPSAASGTRYSNKSQVFLHSGQDYGSRHYSYWESAEIDLADGGVYVEMCRYKVWKASETNKTNNTLRHPNEIGELIKKLALVGIKVEVYGVRSGLVKKFRKSDDWVDLWTYAKNALQAIVTKNDMDKHIAQSSSYQRFSNARYYVGIGEHLTTKAKSPMNEFVDLIAEMKESVKVAPHPQQYLDLASTFGVKIDTPKKIDLSQQEKALYMTYPLLDLVINDASGAANCRKVADYVKMVDKQ